jgi:hypothetical protein
MPKLIFHARPDGLFVDVLIGLDGATTAALLAAGQPIPAPIRARSLIDTGSDVTVVSGSILARLGIPAQYRTTTQTISGPVAVNLFEVSVGITDFARAGSPELVEAHLLVMELTSPPHGLDVLIGLDIMLGCRMVLAGPARQFTLEF